jgi:hypothetical protein
MSRRAVVLVVRGRGPAKLAAGALVSVAAGLAWLAMSPAPDAEPGPPGAVAGIVAASPLSAAAAEKPAAPRSEAVPAQPVAAAARPADRVPDAPAGLPYRFLGKSTTGTETSIVLFGRGRTLSLARPGPLDDQYLVEAVFDDYIVIRHVPTGVGQFLPLVHRLPATAASPDPEASPRD